MVSPEKQMHEELRECADLLEGRVWESATRLIRDAAAEIEGHNEAFAQVVADKCAAEAAKRHTETNLRGAYDLIYRWRALLAELRNARPLSLYGDAWIEKIDKAFAGGANPVVSEGWRDHVAATLSDAGYSRQADVIRQIQIDEAKDGP